MNEKIVKITLRLPEKLHRQCGVYLFNQGLTWQKFLKTQAEKIAQEERTRNPRMIAFPEVT